MLWFSSEIHKGLEEGIRPKGHSHGQLFRGSATLCSTTVELRWQLKRIRYWSWSRST